jgi:alkylated DNA repair dioxygenase AlkB
VFAVSVCHKPSHTHTFFMAAALDFRKILLEERKKARLAIDRREVEVVHTIIQRTESVTPIPPAISDVKELQLNKDIAEDEMFSLDKFKVGDVSSLFYIPNIISLSTEDEMLRLVSSSSWVSLRTRRLQLWGELPNEMERSNFDKSIDNKLPKWLRHIADQLHRKHIFPVDLYPNNVLINQYESDQGIMHHTDGPSYSDYVVIFSLGSDCIMTFKPNLKSEEIGNRPSDDVCSIVLRHGSLLVFKESLYVNHLHGIYSNEEEQVVGVHGPCVNLEAAQSSVGDKVTKPLTPLHEYLTDSL